MTTIKLQSSDGVIFTLDQAVANRSHIIKVVWLDYGLVDPGEEVIPVTNVNSIILTKIFLEWAHHHQNDPVAKSGFGNADKCSVDLYEISDWDEAFFGLIDEAMIIEIIKATHYQSLDVPDLYQIACQVFAKRTEGLSREQIAWKYNLAGMNGFFLQDVETIRQEVTIRMMEKLRW